MAGFHSAAWSHIPCIWRLKVLSYISCLLNFLQCIGTIQHVMHCILFKSCLSMLYPGSVNIVSTTEFDSTDACTLTHLRSIEPGSVAFNVITTITAFNVSQRSYKTLIKKIQKWQAFTWLHGHIFLALWKLKSPKYYPISLACSTSYNAWAPFSMQCTAFYFKSCLCMLYQVEWTLYLPQNLTVQMHVHSLTWGA